jgi:hypothetical protein
MVEPKVCTSVYGSFINPMSARAASVLIWLVIAVAPALAAADEPPPFGYQERCTLENGQAEGDECVTFDYSRGRRVAPAFLASHGFCFRCGAWTPKQAIMCRPKGSGPPLERGWFAACEDEERRLHAAEEAARDAWKRQHCRSWGCSPPEPPTDSFRPAPGAVLGWRLSNEPAPACPTAATEPWTLAGSLARAALIAATLGGATFLVLGAVGWSRRRRQKGARPPPSTSTST